MGVKERFIKVAKERIKREGIDDLLKLLENTDFFTAPASTRYHHSYEGGLAKHSLEVFDILDTDLNLSDFDKESIAIVSLFHDICKVGYYEVSTRNTKDENGKWIQVPYYTVDDKFPYGHGEKSVYLISGVMKLTDEEAMAIRWHMGLSEKDNYNYVSKAFEMFPLSLHLHLADMKSAYLLGREKE
jgi:hypothetical protein